MMTQQRQNILVVEVNSETFKDIEAVLQRVSFDVDWLPTAKNALELVSLVPFSAVVLNYPLATVPYEEFIACIRAESSASREAKVALLAFEPVSARVHLKQPGGADVVIPTESDAVTREHQLCGLLGIPPRAAVRMLVRLEVALIQSKRERFMAQTKDLSASGMFLVTDRRFPVGSRARVAFNLPGDPEPFGGEVEVARHSDPERDPVQGLGMRFISFEDGGPRRLERFLEKLKQ
jgi:hypothetical protein